MKNLILEKFRNNKILFATLIIFLLITVIHIIYASLSYRGLYGDGTYYMIKQLTNCANHNIDIYTNGHARFSSAAITQLPILIAYNIFFIKNKFALMFIYTFFQLAIPVFALFWGYKLSKRTEKPGLFLFNVFMYCCIILTFEIWSVVESIQGAAFNIILFNYMIAKIDYTKKDIAAIIFLIFMMFGTYEYVIYLGVMFFIFSLYYIKNESSLKNRLIKLLIGLGSLAASAFNIYYLFRPGGEYGEIREFFDTATITDNWSSTNIILTLTIIIFILLFANKKRLLNKTEFFITTAILTILYTYLMVNHNTTLIPCIETSYRMLPCILIPLIIIFYFISDVKNKSIGEIKYSNLLCLILICGIFQTLFQTVHTYYWNENISYFKNQLLLTKEKLYIPEEHEEISSEENPDNKKRYIWISLFPALSILLSDNYEQKTLALTYKEEYKEFKSFREELYVSKLVKGKMKLPTGIFTDIKNEFWDLTDCAESLDEYNIKNNIKLEQET